MTGSVELSRRPGRTKGIGFRHLAKIRLILSLQESGKGRRARQGRDILYCPGWVERAYATAVRAAKDFAQLGI